MLHTRRQNEFGTWYIPGRKPVISYSFALMAGLGEAAQKASPAPVAGVLFGTTDDSEIRITAFRSIPVAAATASSRAVSGGLFDEAGESELNRVVNTYASEPDLTGLRPVGWYRSRAEEGIQLNEADVRIWNGFFPHLTQVTLVLRVDERQADEPVRAGFFFRPRHGGSPRTDSSYRTFVVGPAPEATGDVGRLAEAVIGSGGNRRCRPPRRGSHSKRARAFAVITPTVRSDARPTGGRAGNAAHRSRSRRRLLH